jgi:lauroyl/myristoyl acyltransferase
MRTRFGTKLIEMKNTFRGMLSGKNEINATAFIADQTPQPDNAHWITFLNQETPVFPGTEVIARKFNYPVIYTSVKRLRRGYYDTKYLQKPLLKIPPQLLKDKSPKCIHADWSRISESILKPGCGPTEGGNIRKFKVQQNKE